MKKTTKSKKTIKTAKTAKTRKTKSADAELSTPEVNAPTLSNGRKKSLVIVESPTKCKTLKKFLGRDFDVQATVGHIKDLPKSKLGVDVDNDFKPDYAVIKGKEKVISQLKKDAAKVDKIYLAPDPDREGEAIAWHVAEELKKKGTVIKRAYFNEITKSAVLSGLEQAGEIDYNMVQAQQARRVLDRLVGYKVSPILWKTVYRGLSAGRVQSVALRMVCERENEVVNFKPEEYWSIKALLETQKREKFHSSLAKIDGNDFKITSQKESDTIVADLKTKDFKVTDVRKQEKKRNPYPPYTTSTLQQDASRRLGYAPARTMMLAQQLYEGIELQGGEQVGLITYMRTDSVRIAEEALGHVRKYISLTFGEKYLPEQPNYYKSKKSAQDAHEAIRPTFLEHHPTQIQHFLTKEQFRLYELIWNRFVACQMVPAVFDTISVDIAAGKYLFRSNSSILKFDGFLKTYEDIKEENGNGEEEQEFQLPELAAGQPLQLLDLTPEQHFTKPPPRFSEASLIKEMEANGIGRPSTYAAIISTLKNRKYVESIQRRLTPTDLGMTVNKILIQNFPEIFSVGFTAEMEEELDKIEEGEMKWTEVISDFYQPFSGIVNQATKNTTQIRESHQEESKEKCDKCGSPMLIRWGRNGKFLACSAYPDCKNAKPLNHKEEKAMLNGAKCELCGGVMVIKSGRFGRFIACSNYPECKNTKSITMGIPCPEKECDGEVVERRSKKGRVFYSCSRYPKCKFSSWDKPVAESCPDCESKYLVEKYSKAKGNYIKCPKCEYVKSTEPEPAT
ncbi:MAG: type I DNA topoisomerase [candidate division Zixibacteria bacterium]|nr:type I DNA topoisomerase [candidate division Zixibacteria bacterium]